MCMCSCNSNTFLIDTTPPITTSSAISIFDSSVLPSVTVTGSPTIVPVQPPSSLSY